MAFCTSTDATAASVAEKLSLSTKTIKVHLSAIYRKWDVRNVAGMVVFAYRNKVVTVEEEKEEEHEDGRSDRDPVG